MRDGDPVKCVFQVVGIGSQGMMTIGQNAVDDRNRQILTLVDFDDKDSLKKAVDSKKKPLYVPARIERGTYPVINGSNIDTIGIKALLVANQEWLEESGLSELVNDTSLKAVRAFNAKKQVESSIIVMVIETFFINILTSVYKESNALVFQLGEKIV